MMHISFSFSNANIHVYRDFKGWNYVAAHVISSRNINTRTALTMNTVIPVVERSVFRPAIETRLPGTGISLFHVPNNCEIFPGTSSEFNGYHMQLKKGMPAFSLLACTYSNEERNIVPFERIERSVADTRSGLGSLKDLMVRRLTGPEQSGLLGYYVLNEGELCVVCGLPEDIGTNGITGKNIWETISSNLPLTGVHAGLFFLNPASYSETIPSLT
jgi:hypothetical protein